MLYEVIGYSLAKTAKPHKAIIFKRKRTEEIGKSSVFHIIRALLKVETGVDLYERPYSHEHLENLCGSKAGSKTTLKQLNEVTVNFLEDQTQPKYIDNSIITRLISGEPISIKQKGDENFELISYATLLFSINDDVINFKDTSKSITDRFVVIPFNATFTDSEGNRNINIVEELCKPKALQIIATRAVQAFDKVLQNGKFTIPDIVEQETDRYFMVCNPALQFCNLYTIENFIPKKQYYVEYCTWCEENNYKPLGNSGFGKVVMSFGYGEMRRTFKGVQNTFYVNPEFDTERCYSFYMSFKLAKDAREIDYYMTFEQYLGKLIFLNELNELERLEIEKIQEIEPKERFFE